MYLVFQRNKLKKKEKGIENTGLCFSISKKQLVIFDNDKALKIQACDRCSKETRKADQVQSIEGAGQCLALVFKETGQDG